MDLLNLQSSVTSYVGKAQPLCQHPRRTRESNKQKFANTPNVSRVSRFSRVQQAFTPPMKAVRSVFRTIQTAIASSIQPNEDSQQPLLNIQKTCKRGERYEVVDGVDRIRLFSKEEIDYDQYGKRMNNPLNAQIDIPLNGSGLLKAINANLIKLDLPAIIRLWELKMCNPMNKHYVKYLTAMGLPNLKPYPHKLEDGGETREFDYVIPQLSPHMDKIQQCFALLYTGYVLLRLLNDTPTFYVKNKYEFEERLKPKRSRIKPNKNDATYFYEYRTPFQFVIDEDTTHKIVIFTSFHISRTKLKAGNSDVTETRATLATCYPVGNEKNIRCSLWAEDRNKTILNPEYEQTKFESVVAQFKPDNFLNALKLLIPGFEKNDDEKRQIKVMLRLLGFDDQIIDDILVGEINYPAV